MKREAQGFFDGLKVEPGSVEDC